MGIEKFRAGDEVEVWSVPDSSGTLRIWDGEHLPLNPVGSWGLTWVRVLGCNIISQLYVECPPGYHSWPGKDTVVLDCINGAKVSIDGKLAWAIFSSTVVSHRPSHRPIEPPPRARVQCQQCGYGDHFTAANQPDGTFVCYSCREDPYAASFTGGDWW